MSFQMNKMSEYTDDTLQSYLGCDQLGQEAGWGASDPADSAGTSQQEGWGGRWRSEAHTGPQGRAGEGKDRQTWNISDLSEYFAGEM